MSGCIARELYFENIPDSELSAELLARAIKRWAAKIAEHEAGLGVMREKQARRVAELEQLESKAESGKLKAEIERSNGQSKAESGKELPTCRYCHEPVADMAAHKCAPMVEYHKERGILL